MTNPPRSQQTPSISREVLLGLQRDVGNRVVSRLLSAQREPHPAPEAGPAALAPREVPPGAPPGGRGEPGTEAGRLPQV
jgi:hypothetical protein